MINNDDYVVYLSTYPPRKCGIATFTQDLSTAIDKVSDFKHKSKIIALNNNGNTYDYSNDVIFQINDKNTKEYVEIARKINENDKIKLVCIQHEFKIFGSDFGENLLFFLEEIKKPVVTTFHSVLSGPSDERKKIIRSIAEKSNHLIVMNQVSVDILRRDYELKNSKIEIIPHGVHNTPYESNLYAKTELDYKDKNLIISFGFLRPGRKTRSSGRGYEHVLDALPRVVEKFSNLLYLIIGVTHPNTLKKEGETYRNLLKNKVKELGLEKNVIFINEYVELKKIIRFLHATDIYIASALNPNQSVSGTLAYAMGCGKPVIATPFVHSIEAITPERGILVELGNSKSYADAIIKLLSNPKLREEMGKNAYKYTRKMVWSNVAKSYIKIFKRYLNIKDKFEKSFPKIKFNHLTQLTDDFGILQFANYTKPDKSEGYTLDDNSRAMIVCCMHYNKFKNDSQLKLIKIYLDFIKHIQQDGKLFNFVDYNRKINHSRWTDDAPGRTLWSLGFLISTSSLPIELRKEAEQILKKSLGIVHNIKSPRAVAFTILGLYFYNKAKPSSEIVSTIKVLADYLIRLYNNKSSEEWQWFEAYLTYSNSKLPESLFYAYLATKNEEYLNIAKSTLNFLTSLTFENDMFAPIGHDGWYFKDGNRAHFDQQPVDTASMVQTLILANDITREEKYKRNAIIAFQWFLGNNILNQMVYDAKSGGCHDGIGQSSVNLNQGAESTISYLIARLSIEDAVQHKDVK